MPVRQPAECAPSRAARRPRDKQVPQLREALLVETWFSEYDLDENLNAPMSARRTRAAVHAPDARYRSTVHVAPRKSTPGCVSGRESLLAQRREMFEVIWIQWSTERRARKPAWRS